MWAPLNRLIKTGSGLRCWTGSCKNRLSWGSLTLPLNASMQISLWYQVLQGHHQNNVKVNLQCELNSWLTIKSQTGWHKQTLLAILRSKSLCHELSCMSWAMWAKQMKVAPQETAWSPLSLNYKEWVLSTMCVSLKVDHDLAEPPDKTVTWPTPGLYLWYLHRECCDGPCSLKLKYYMRVTMTEIIISESLFWLRVVEVCSIATWSHCFRTHGKTEYHGREQVPTPWQSGN